MIRLFKHISIIVFLSVGLTVSGRDSLDMRKLYHDVEMAASGGYNLPSHGYFNGYNPLKKPLYFNSSLHLKYGFGFQPGTRFGSLYPNVTQGVGLAAATFYSQELMGSPVFAYIFQRAQLMELNPRLKLNYAWDFGASFGWKQTELIATRANIYINVGVMLSWDLNRHLSLNFGPEFTHCSNGDTRYPNGGVNLFNLKVGLTGHIEPETGETDRTVIEHYRSQLKQKSFAERMEYDLVLYGGWRAGKVVGLKSYVINEHFPFFGLNFMPLYRISRHFTAGASLDLLADRSANLYDVVYDADIKSVVSYSRPTLGKQMAAGISIRGEITMPIFTLGVGAGGFVLPAGDSLRGIYTVFCLKTFVTDHLFANISYRLSTKNYTHNMMYGLGWRF